jgi:hypothetical protein
VAKELSVEGLYMRWDESWEWVERCERRVGIRNIERSGKQFLLASSIELVFQIFFEIKTRRFYLSFCKLTFPKPILFHKFSYFFRKNILFYFHLASRYEVTFVHVPTTNHVLFCEIHPAHKRTCRNKLGRVFYLLCPFVFFIPLMHNNNLAVCFLPAR